VKRQPSEWEKIKKIIIIIKRMGENNSKGSNCQRINLKNIQATPAAQFQKNK